MSYRPVEDLIIRRDAARRVLYRLLKQTSRPLQRAVYRAELAEMNRDATYFPSN